LFRRLSLLNNRRFSPRLTKVRKRINVWMEGKDGRRVIVSDYEIKEGIVFQKLK